MTAISPTVYTGPFTGNGSTTAFVGDFTVADASEIEVQVNGAAVSSSLYSVSLSDDGVPTVTFYTAPITGAAVLLVSAPSWTQETEFVNEGAYKLSAVNQINKRNSIRSNWLRRALDRTIILPVGQDGAILPATGRAGKVISFDADGNPELVDGTGTGAIFRPSSLTAGSVPTDASIAIDNGTTVVKATPLQIVDTARPVASQAEAEAGTDTAKLMTPQRVGQAITALSRSVASQGEAETGTDNAKVMTPLRVKQSVAANAPTPSLASQAEAEAGTDNAKTITALRAKQALVANVARLTTPISIDPTGGFVARDSMVTINRSVTVPAGVGTGLSEGVVITTQVQGDNTNFKGGGGIYINTSDKAGITSGQRGVLYGISIDIVPNFSRNNFPHDDATGVIVTNTGTGQGTEAVYIGRNPNGIASDWYASFGSDANGVTGAYFTGTYQWGIDFGKPSFHATLTGSCLRGPPDCWLLSVTNAANSIDRQVVSTTSDGAITLLDGFQMRQNLTWTPTITADSGTYTTKSIVWSRYSIINKRVFVELNVLVTTKGTAVGALKFTLPIAPRTTEGQGAVGYGLNSLNGKMLVGASAASVMRMTHYDGTDPLANSTNYVMSFSYEADI